MTSKTPVPPPNTPPAASEIPYYFDSVDIEVDARTIPCHPYVDECNARLLYRLIEALNKSQGRADVLDAGAGSGQVSRLLLGLPGVSVYACDRAPQVGTHFAASPELRAVRYFNCDLTRDRLPQRFSIIVSRGAYHHLPKDKRSSFISSMLDAADVLIVADEAVAEYGTERDRLAHCEAWYQHVISEAERKGLPELAKLEREFLREEQDATADRGGDFKESPREFLLDARSAGAAVTALDRVGPWDTFFGGFFVAVLKRDSAA